MLNQSSKQELVMKAIEPRVLNQDFLWLGLASRESFQGTPEAIISKVQVKKIAHKKCF